MKILAVQRAKIIIIFTETRMIFPINSKQDDDTAISTTSSTAAAT